jgi:hypothetical protein
MARFDFVGTLKLALEIVQREGVAELERLIADHEHAAREKARRTPTMETR